MNKSKFLEESYKPMLKEFLSLSAREIDSTLIDAFIDYKVKRDLKPVKVNIINEGMGLNNETNSLDIISIINKYKFISNPYGVLYTKHGEVPNLIVIMLNEFLNNRDAYKKMRNAEIKGSPEFAYYDLLQLLAKIDANALYGVHGLHSSIFYNIYVASSITTAGRHTISASGLFLEMFLNNNVKFSSLEDLLGYIHNVINEEITIPDEEILCKSISIDDCFTKIILTCGFNYIPNIEDMNIVYNMLYGLNQTQINRLYYKNNLYELINDSPKVLNLIRRIFSTMNEPMIFPVKPPDIIKDDMVELKRILREFIYYKYMQPDKYSKYSKMIRSVDIVTDTDSVIVSFYKWYKFIMDKIKDIDVPLRRIQTDRNLLYSGKVKTFETHERTNFSAKAMEEEIELNPDMIPPQEGLRFSVLNVMANIIDEFLNDYMVEAVKSFGGFNTADGVEPVCRIFMKNEFLMKSMLVTNNKKNYASIIELQEGKYVPKSKSLDIKGMPITKSTLNATTRDRLKTILERDILNKDENNFSKIKILEELDSFKDDIIKSIRNGEKIYYKPSTVKPIKTYDDPYSVQGIKASVVYNIIKDEYDDFINLDDRNRINILPIDINKNNIASIKNINEDIYVKLSGLLSQKAFKNGITTVAVPDDIRLPEWILDYVDYTKIVSANTKNFPIEYVGIVRGKGDIPFTNIVKI